MRRKIAALIAATALLFPATTGAASGDKVLSKDKGGVYVGASATDKSNAITGQLIVQDNQFAITDANSVGTLTLPDSSTVQLAALTIVQVGAFNDPASSTPTTITIGAGRVAFNVKRPAGGKSNYRFVTPSSAMAVRGTSALIARDDQGDTYACVDCGKGDVDVTVGDKVYPLQTGQTLRVSILGAVVIGALTAAILSSFTGAGISTAYASSASLGAAGAGAGAGGAGAGAGGAGAGAGAASGAAAAGVAGTTVAAAAAVAVAAVAVAAANNPTPVPSSTGTINLTQVTRKPLALTPTPTPSPTPTPNAHQAGHR